MGGEGMGRKDNPISFPICSRPGTEEPGLPAGKEQQQNGVSTNPLRLPTREAARPRALLSLVRQQDKLRRKDAAGTRSSAE